MVSDDVRDMISFLATECDWPIDEDLIKHVAWEIDNELLGISNEAIIDEVKVYELRPLTNNQPWGVFFVSVNGNSNLSVTLLRRLLKALVKKKRASINTSKIKQFNLSDLMFVCSLNKMNEVTRYFAHFRDQEKGLPKLMIGSRWQDNQPKSEIDAAKKHIVSGLKWPSDVKNISNWRNSWSNAFHIGHKEIINTTSKLTECLALSAKQVKAKITEIYHLEREDGPIKNLYKAVEEGLISGIQISEFSDMIAQTITYGLFSVRATSEEQVSINSLAQSVENTNPFLRDFMLELNDLSGDDPGDLDFDELGLTDLIDNLNEVNIGKILEEFGTQFKDGVEDPVIHFYEAFLKAYDNELKVKRGVFYTPKPAVDFIVKGVHERLKSQHGIKNGLANVETHMVSGKEFQKVLILDPAVGTGTFLVSVIEHIHREMVLEWKNEGLSKKQISTNWNEYVDAYLFDKMFGFELMMAPYSISHLKIGLTLKRTGYVFRKPKRLQIFLTNTLEPSSELSNWMPNFLTEEAKLASQAKTSVPFSVIVGNPPYSGHSTNNSPFVKNLVEDYKKEFPDLSKPGQGKWLQDDYVKFFRVSQFLLEKSPLKILGFITNHGFLANPTFKGMRKHILDEFTNLDFIDLDGNSNTNTSNDDGNIFEIKQGVAISFLSNVIKQELRVNFLKVNGKKAHKLKVLKSGTISDQYTEINPIAPFYIFSDIDTDISGLYSKYLSLPEIFSIIPKPAPGIVTTHDQFAIAHTPMEMTANIETFLSTKNEKEARALFKLCTQSQWNYNNAKHALGHMPWREKMVSILQRPYDVRYTIYDPNVSVHLRKRITGMMLGEGENWALISSRRLEVSKQWSHVFASNRIIQHHSVSTKEVNYLFPLYSSTSEETRISNISEELLNSINSSRKDVSMFEIGDVFMYIYGILHSNLYRNYFDQELRIDWPRIPIWKNPNLQDKISQVGRDIYTSQVHFQDLKTTYQSKIVSHGKMNKIEYIDGEIKIDGKLVFAGIDKSLWEYEIGGAQIIKKFLMDRKGRELSTLDLETIGRIITSIEIVIRKSIELDVEILGGKWPTDLELIGSVQKSQSTLF